MYESKISLQRIISAMAQLKPNQTKQSDDVAKEHGIVGRCTNSRSFIRTYCRSHYDFRYGDKLKFVWVRAAFGFMWDAYNSLVGENPDSSNSLSHAYFVFHHSSA